MSQGAQSSAIKGPVVGVDCGTCYSAVSIYRNGKCEIIANSQGNRTTPSVVAFTDTERLVGEPAKNQAPMNPRNTVFEIKRLMGRKWSDPKIQELLQRFPFEVVNRGDKPCVRVDYLGEKKVFTPEEISAMILEEMKKTAEAYLGEPVRYAVITIPAYFSEQARQATKDAATIAGLNCIRLISEPTAASLAYGFDKKYREGKKTLCILDSGGGTYDISIIELEDGVYEVKSVSGNALLGGADIDNVMVDHCVAEFKSRTGVDLTGNDRAIRRLRSACERAKRTLSSQPHVDIEVDTLAEGRDFNLRLTRPRFEQLAAAIFREHIKLIPDALKGANKSKADIDEVVLVGGTTRIPKLRQMFSEFFGGKQLSTDINPDEAVALGAGIQAAVLSGNKDAEMTQLLVIDVSPLSLGIETAGGVMTPIIPRNSAIPTKKAQVFSTYSDNQTSVTIKIFEGERPMTRDCHRIGNFDLHGIPPAPRGVPQIEVTIDVDANGIMTVIAQDLSTKAKESIKITNDTNRLSKEQVERMVADAEKYRAADEKVKATHEARSKLEATIHHGGKLAQDLEGKTDTSALTAKCQELQAWLSSHPEEEAEMYQSEALRAPRGNEGCGGRWIFCRKRS